MGEPVGEEAWLSLVDEGARSAADLEQRVEVVELYKRAVNAEPYSLRLWLAYCEWIWSLYTDCQSADAGWSEEEQQLGQELFSLETALDIWRQGAYAIRYRLDDSHVLWNRWIGIELEQLAKTPSQAGIEHIKKLYLDRLQEPHATWDETSSALSSFLTKYDEAHWEETMVLSTKLAKQAKEIYGQREDHELKTKRAHESGDKVRLRAAIAEYLDWEIFQSRKKDGNNALLFALYERCLLLLGTDASLWEDYATTMNGYLTAGGRSDGLTSSLFHLLQRATKHCPWSGALWSRYLLKGEIERLSFSEIEQIKHSATSAGQLDRDGMNDVLAVYVAWCGYLKRRATSRDSTDEDVDVTDVGLCSAVETVHEWGERLYGKNGWKGDPLFQLERCWIQYLTEKGHVSEAREQWNKLIRSHGDNYEFWQRYYHWEMTVRNNIDHDYGTDLLKQALQRKTLDWPEKIIEMYLLHCSTYESAEGLATAIDVAYKNTKGVAKRRQREAADAAAAYAQQQQEVKPIVEAEMAAAESPSGVSKRKRDSVSEPNGIASKRFKTEGDDYQFAQQHLKRDRENTSILVTNLPAEVTQTKVRQYFKEYGHVNQLVIKTEKDGRSTTALIEFRSVEDVQSALLRDGKYFSDREISVVPGTGLTIFVTNFPPTADEAYIRNLFKSCGEIFSTRWPSLKYNTHRRFCYVSFKSAADAAAATKLDGKLLEGHYKLQAKYSEPSKKKEREGAMTEGRELHVSNVEYAATEEDVKEIFSKYGTVESVRIPKDLAGKSKGTAFVVFEKKEDAQAALQLDKTKFKALILNVELASYRNFKPTSTTHMSASASPAPDHDADGDSNMSPVLDSHSHSGDRAVLSRAELTARTITLLNVPDTINDARIRALVSPHGEINKLTLRPDHQGAIVEFTDVASAGKAALALDNYEIAPGRTIHTGGMKDLFAEKGEIRSDRIQIGVGKKADDKGMGAGNSGREKVVEGRARQFMPSVQVRRPGVSGRGGLGRKRGLGYASGLRAATKENDGETVTAEKEKANGVPSNGHPKSNADFRALFVKGGEP
jgi:RNA recognition motif-containing protein